jgi:hypothetical protein
MPLSSNTQLSAITESSSSSSSSFFPFFFFFLVVLCFFGFSNFNVSLAVPNCFFFFSPLVCCFGQAKEVKMVYGLVRVE